MTKRNSPALFEVSDTVAAKKACKVLLRDCHSIQVFEHAEQMLQKGIEQHARAHRDKHAYIRAARTDG
jgi:hypothetical protein